MITLCFIGWLSYMFCVIKLVDFIWYKYDNDLLGGFVFMLFTVMPLVLFLDFIV